MLHIYTSHDGMDNKGKERLDPKRKESKGDKVMKGIVVKGIVVTVLCGAYHMLQSLCGLAKEHQGQIVRVKF